MRPSWDKYFMDLTTEISKRSTCIRRQVGAIIVANNVIVSTGYNGSPKGFINCCDIGLCLRKENNIESGTHQEICHAIHAEINCIISAANRGVSISNGIMYCTHAPCSICARIISNSNINQVIYLHDYPDELSYQYLKDRLFNIKLKEGG